MLQITANVLEYKSLKISTFYFYIASIEMAKFTKGKREEFGRVSRCARCHFCNANNRDNVAETESDCAIFLKRSYVSVCVCTRGIYDASTVHLTHSRSIPRIFLEAHCNLNIRSSTICDIM